MTTLGAEHGFLEVFPKAVAARRANRHVVLLLHGLGGNKSDWAYPAWRGNEWDHRREPSNRRSDNHLTPPYVNPLNLFESLTNYSLSDLDPNIRCWEGLLQSVGHTTMNYSQNGYDDEVEVPLTQLVDQIVPFIRENVLVGPLAGKKVILLCHSRGGILARKYIHDHRADAIEWIEHVITLCSPHQGTMAPKAKEKLAQAAIQLAIGPLSSAVGIDDLLVRAIDKITGMLSESAGANQLLPNNPIFGSLVNPADVPEIDFTTFGGASVRYTKLYYWLYEPSSFVPNFSDFPDVRFDYELFPVELPLISPMMDQLPDSVVDDEQDNDEGDGLVSNKRAMLPGAPHTKMPLNHAEALWDETLFQIVANLLGTPLSGNEVFECMPGFIGNTRTMQVHDPERESRNCQLNEIVAPIAFKSAEEATASGYDGCYWCLSELHTPD